ncbi:AAA family ATPase [Youngiibacter multivorans]|uniref:ABC-type multidrug transport system ATPase subunit n=1 Tax=Youngiibacter multivorans TaxID=937251 RepID=A0ABS4FZX4_9CLOT|nr:AAA family ATPase [Youngiibacter multivorans]MBP1917842.1 ABC-type multidrug transport system ATPase subunit [Youngiibacter multivorans]
MRILKIKATGLNLFSDSLELEFVTQQRVRNESSEMLFKIAPKIYQNNVLAFIGVNASGKTMTLKLISFIIQMLNNESINKIEKNEILNGISNNEKITLETYFSVELENVYKLVTIIKKDENSIEGESKYIIEDEKIWKKAIKDIKTRKSLFEFDGLDPIQVRKGDEEFLPEDVSIVIAINKKSNTKIYYRDLINMTNINLIRILGDFPKELITFLDPSIEYIKPVVDKSEEKVEIRLKFKGKEEIIMYRTSEMAKYLSSGTIKGINVFMYAMMVLERGGYLIVDELENHFNKEIAATLIRFFLDHEVNKNGATIIFSTHYAELLDEFERNDDIFITRNNGGITVENLSKILKRNDIKKSEAYESGYLRGTTPMYEAYIDLKTAIIETAANLR